MVRRRSRPKYDTTIPTDWIPHNGGQCQVDPASKPAVMFRYGARMRPGTMPARYFFGWACGNLWEWSGSTHDIVAYKPEADCTEKELRPILHHRI